MTSAGFTGSAFGLGFHSNRPLPELSPVADSSCPRDVHIEWAEPWPGELGQVGAQTSFHCHAGVFQLDVPAVASFQVQGSRIDIRPAGGSDERSVRTYLFGSAIGALLQLRGLTVLHGSAVELPDGSAAVFCGPSTAGKSTLAAALAARGYPVLADDLTAVRIDPDGQAWCLPGLARTKLWRDALDALGLASRASPSTRVMPDLDKHSLEMSTGTRSAPLRRFYELQPQDGLPLEFSGLAGMAKMTVLLGHSYRPAYLGAMGQAPALLRSAAAIAPRMTMWRIARPRHVHTLEAIVAWLEQQWSA